MQFRQSHLGWMMATPIETSSPTGSPVRVLGSFLADESASTTIEYGLISASTAIVMVAVVLQLGNMSAKSLSPRMTCSGLSLDYVEPASGFGRSSSRNGQGQNDLRTALHSQPDDLWMTAAPTSFGLKI